MIELPGKDIAEGEETNDNQDTIPKISGEVLRVVLENTVIQEGTEEVCILRCIVQVELIGVERDQPIICRHCDSRIRLPEKVEACLQDFGSSCSARPSRSQTTSNSLHL